MFSKIRRYLNIKSALAIYKSMILPYFDYGDIIFMSANIQEIKKLDKLHIRGLRICFKTQGRNDDIELFNLANISNLSNRRKNHLRNYMFKKINVKLKLPIILPQERTLDQLLPYQKQIVMYTKEMFITQVVLNGTN